MSCANGTEGGGAPKGAPPFFMPAYLFLYPLTSSYACPKEHRLMHEPNTDLPDLSAASPNKNPATHRMGAILPAHTPKDFAQVLARANNAGASTANIKNGQPGISTTPFNAPGEPIEYVHGYPVDRRPTVDTSNFEQLNHFLSLYYLKRIALNQVKFLASPTPEGTVFSPQHMVMRVRLYEILRNGGKIDKREYKRAKRAYLKATGQGWRV